jgi:hypothetical protein
MIQSRRPKLLDLVAVLKCSPDADVEVGDVGTVVELLSPGGIEVEFLDCDGRKPAASPRCPSRMC